MRMHAHSDLQPLTDSHLSIPNPLEDVRWRSVIDGSGRYIGKIDELLIDEHLHRVQFLRVRSWSVGGLGTSTTLVPADDVQLITESVVRLKPSEIAEAPGYHPTLVDESYYADVPSHYFGY